MKSLFFYLVFFVYGVVLTITMVFTFRQNILLRDTKSNLKQLQENFRAIELKYHHFFEDRYSSNINCDCEQYVSTVKLLSHQLELLSNDFYSFRESNIFSKNTDDAISSNNELVEEKQTEYLSEITRMCLKKKSGEQLESIEKIQYDMLWGLMNDENRETLKASCPED